MDNPVRESESTKLTPKSIAGRFKIVRELGRGGAGVVFEGVQLSVDRRVAIKVLHSDHQAKEDHVERFTREAKAIARLSHTNCITLFDFGFSEEFRAHYMVMEYIEGEELFAVTRERKLPFNIALRIAIQISDAIAHAHKHGILHRDLKPENVLVTSDWEVKVLDFGLARLLDLFSADAGGRRLTAEGAIFGTPAYMSPEQCAGDLDVTVRSDIYSLGIVLYELFEGQLPFRAKEIVKILVQQAKDPPPPMEADVPDDVKRLIRQMLAKDPQARPRTGTQVADRLRAVLFSMAHDSAEMNADVSQEIQRSLLRGIDRTDQTGENIRTTEDGLETRTEPMDGDEAPRSRASTMELSGRRVGDYTVGQMIGKGPNCSVFEGTSASGNSVAIRVLTRAVPESVRISPDFIERLTALKGLRGPTVGALLDGSYDPQIKRFFLISELIDGDDLLAICRAGRAPTELAVLVGRDVAAALVAAHSKNIVHQGLKTSNVMLVPGSDGRPRAKVLDFGLATLGTEEHRATHDTLKPDALRYVAPEQFRGDNATEASDLYALGVMLYEMLSGHAPFTGKTHTELATAVLGSAAPPLAEYIREVPSELSRLVAELLDKNPARRPGSAQEVLNRLDAVRNSQAIREVHVEHQGKSADVASAWRLRRSVQAPAPGGQTVAQRSTAQLAAVPAEAAIEETPKKSGGSAFVVIIVLVLVVALVAGLIAAGVIPLSLSL